MSDDATLKAIQTLGAQLIQVRARCDALDAVVCMLAMRQGIPRERIEAAIDRVTVARHQARLERIEDFDPGTAADLDRRAPGSDLSL